MSVLPSRRRTLAAFVLSSTLCAGLACATAAPASAAAGTSYTWVGSLNGSGGDDHSWGDANNWSPAGVPGTGDSVTIAPPDVTLCHAHVDNTPNVALANFTLEEIEPPGSLCEASVTGGSISVSGAFTWHGGNLDTPTTLLADSSGTVRPSSGVYDTSYLSQDLTVHGTLVLDQNLTLESHSGQNLLISAGASLTVAKDGELDANDSNDVDGSSCCVDPPRLVNHGLLQVNGGRLDVNAVEVDNTAHLDTTAHGELRTSAARQTSSSGASFTGNGSWQLFTATTTRLTGSQTLAPDFHLVLGGNGTGGDEIVGGTFSLVGSGTLDWDGGQLVGSATIGHQVSVRAAGVAAGNDGRELDGNDGTDPNHPSDTPSAVTNHGTISFSGGAGYYATEGGRIDNSSDGTVSLAAGTVISGDCCLDPGVVANHAGTVTVGSGAQPVDLENTRYLDYGGTTHIAAGQTLQLTGGAPSLFAKNTVTGGGRLDIHAPAAVRTSTTIAKSTTLRLAGYPGTLVADHGAAKVSGAGSFAWTGGTVTGSLTFDPRSVHISGAAPKTIADPASGTTLVKIAAATTVSSGTRSTPDEIDLNGNPRLTLAGATTIGADVLFSHGRLVNTGALRVEAGAKHPVSVSSAGLANSGKVVVASGLLQVDNDYTQSGGSTLVEKNASLKVVGSSSSIAIGDGVLGGSGKLVGPVVNSGGSLRPGVSGVGTLHVGGSYTQGKHASAEFELGAKSGDLLTISGALSLRGRLAVDNLGSYAPGATSVRTIATASDVALDLACTTTKGGGTSGRHARHWVAGRSGKHVRLHSGSGRRTSC